MSKKLVLVDGHSILNRAFYGVRDLTNSEGLHTNAIYGFLNTLFKLIEDEKPDYLAVAFDKSAPTFRHKMYKEYKGTRKKMPDELREQVPVLHDVLKSMNIQIYEQDGLEADDILGTIALKSASKDLDVCIMSGDRDLLQISRDNVCIMVPKTIKGQTTVEKYYPKDVVDKYSLQPFQIIELKSLMGDASDNIPGVAGVGEKTATKLLVEYETLENIYDHIDEITPQGVKTKLEKDKEQAILSKKLATIDTNAQIDYKLDDMLSSDMFNAKSFEMIKMLQFKKFYSKFENVKLDADIEAVGEKNINISKIKLQDFVDANFDKMVKAKRLALIVGKEKSSDKPLLDLIENKKNLFLSYDNDNSYYVEITKAQDISKFISNVVAKGVHIITYDIQNLLHEIDIDFELYASFSDIKLMAYELNPISRESSQLSGIFANDFNEVIEEKIEHFAKISTLIAEKYDKFLKEIGNKNLSFVSEQIDLPCAFILASLEKEGIEVNKEALINYEKFLEVRIEELTKKIYKEAGEEFNISSPKQLSVVLFEKLGLPVIKKTKTGYSTDNSVLEKLSADYEIVSDIMNYRTLSKLKSTYATGLQKFIQQDGRIYGRFHQDATATGRISSTDPNLQNIPIRDEVGQKFREVFIPKDGYVFVDADYSQIELRILAHISNDKLLISAFEQDIDIHTKTASEVFGVDIDKVTPLQRRRAKAVNFGIVYGMSDYGLSQDIKVSRKEAAQYIENYFAKFTGVKKYLDDIKEFAKENGYVTTIDGRIRDIPEINNSNHQIREFGKRVAMNSPIQGSAADIMKKAMILVYKRLLKECKDSKIVLQIHDELLVEAKDSEKDLVCKIIREEMEKAADLRVKLKVDVNTGSNWLEAH